MAQLKVTLTDDNGNELSYHEYLVGEEMTNLNRIERKVEQLRPQILSDMTHDLLAHEQAEYKKNALSEQRQLSDKNQDDKR
ncbi:MAG: hypothetical protein H0W77_08165 [Acidobacteria bacterium]|jgi:hypothetical protein|nr:hypothetical protein [Acidobacteriota bacterium]